MEKGNVISFEPVYEDCANDWPQNHQAISKELERAIQDLIYQLREVGPIAG